MGRLKEALKVALLAWWLLISIGLGYEAIHLRPAIESGLRAANGTLREAGLTLSEVRKGATVWQQASKAQAEESTAVLAQTQQTLARIRLVVQHMDVSLGTLSTALTGAIDQQNQSLLTTQADLQANLKEMLATTQQAQKTLVAAEAQISSPDIKIFMDNAAETSKNTATATREGAETMAEVHEAVSYEVRQLKAPVTKVKAVFNIALTVIRKLFF